MPIWFLKIFQRVCLVGSVLMIITPNLINYYLIDDINLQWDVTITAIAWILFLMMCYVWTNESIRKNKLTIIISGWAALYLLINLIVVLLGWNLYTKGVIEMFIITILAGSAHIGVRLWQKY